MSESGFIFPDWPAPTQVQTVVTTVSSGNLALHVDDDPVLVEKNRARLQGEIGRDTEVQWLRQVHGTDVIHLNARLNEPAPQGDAIFTQASDKACGILTADCLPVLFCDDSGNELAAAHAGWRGLVAGILENTISHFSVRPQAIMAWLGPAIGPCHFEVGEEVREAFVNSSPGQEDISAAFSRSINQGKWMADLYQLARLRLAAAGITRVYGGGLCTYCCAENKFYSYRRNKNTGRFATLIWKS